MGDLTMRFFFCIIGTNRGCREAAVPGGISVNIIVIDGQSGRLGAQLIEGLLQAGIAAENTVTAIGTNAAATAAMLKAGAVFAATGENPVLVACRNADVIAGPVGLVIADAMLGEITPAMAAAIGQSRASKVLLPVNRCANFIIGIADMPRSHLVEEAVARITQLCRPEE